MIVVGNTCDLIWRQ